MTDTKQAAHTPKTARQAVLDAAQYPGGGLSLIPGPLAMDHADELDRLRAERDELVEALEQCAGELEGEFTGTGGKDLSGGLVPRVRALLSRLERP